MRAGSLALSSPARPRPRPRPRTPRPTMDDKQHKAHRPAQSGAKAEKKKGKGKEKQHGFNEKVRRPVPARVRKGSALHARRSPPSLVAGQKSKDAGMRSATRPGCMFPSWTAPPTTSPRRSWSLLSARPVSARLLWSRVLSDGTQSRPSTKFKDLLLL